MNYDCHYYVFKNSVNTQFAKKINNYESLNPNTISDSQNSKPWNRIYLMC